MTKGSVEALHAEHGHGGEAAAWRSALVRADELAGEGFRVLALSAGEVRVGEDWESAPQRLLGLVAMNDPAKPAARTTIEECRAAGIVPVLDHRRPPRDRACRGAPRRVS